MTILKKIVLTLLIISASSVQSNEEKSSNVKIVKQFISAFNAQDSNLMGKFVADDIKWLSIAGEQVNIEAKGKKDLVKSMDAYFKSCPSCRSELSKVISTNNRVSAVEIASWQGEKGFKSQKAMSLYEFSSGLITHVYYFPAEK